MKQAHNLTTFKQRKDTFLRRGRYRWPYIKYSTYLAQPDTLASAGFVFSPAKDAPDNVQCFHCGFELTGWEPTDDPFAEHYAHEPSCSYAKLHCQVRAAARGDKIEMVGWAFETNPNLSAAEREQERKKVVAIRDDVEMRLKTFDNGEWPHTGRSNWNVTPEKLAEAGFYYTPEFPNDDTATCAFCGYALGDWEPDDEPIAEHSKRSPECLFFRLDSTAKQSAAEELTESNKRPSEPQVIDSDTESDTSTTSKRQRISAAHEEELPSNSDPTASVKRDAATDDAAGRNHLETPAREETETEPETEQPLPETGNGYSDTEETPHNSEEREESQETQLTETQVAPASPGVMETDEITDNLEEEGRRQSSQIEAAGSQHDSSDDWELDEEEEEMTVEEFIRACCEQKIAALETSAGQMVDAFMKRAEITRERICSLAW
ncbi:hypothetical protein LPJ79_000107 [Coemansia sp. RSA 1821]|nr:hypothetical protein BX667DRAFT_493824 [Coemansia mojavensis]KAJ1753820.1 hypothetical protein LPJ79_000107 [Coemansia sp. RSA 1821]KAJ2676906.1 hypothetical protein IWW42_000244 [Coemansia sp. RSA 1085]